MRKRYTIEIAATSKLVVSCPHELLQDTLLKKIAFGSKSIEVDFVPHPKKTGLSLAKEFKKHLYFPDFAIPLYVFVDNQVLIDWTACWNFYSRLHPFPVTSCW